MAYNNILYVDNNMLENVVIKTDMKGYSVVNTLNNFKYNQLINSRISARIVNKNTVYLNNIKYPDTLIVSDEHGKNIIEKLDEYFNNAGELDKKNIFLEVLEKIHNDEGSKNDKINTYLSKKRETVQNKLKTATEYFKSKSYSKANNLYRETLDIIETDNYPDEFMLKEYDILAIKIAYALSKVAICKYDQLKSAIDVLTALEAKYAKDFPTLYYYLAKTYYLLENFEKAKETLQTGLQELNNMEDLKELHWPGTTSKMIIKSEKSVLKENLETLRTDCKVLRVPDAICFYKLCQLKPIFFSTPCFNGYVSVKCSANCNFTYHRHCWKMKLKNDGIKKPSSLLEKVCGTDDCGGIICSIIIYDENLRVNTTIKPKIPKVKGKTIPEDDENIEPINPANNKIKKVNKIKNEQDNHVIINKLDGKCISKVDKAKSDNKDITNTVKSNKKDKLNSNAKEYIPLKKKNSPVKTSTLNINAEVFNKPEIETEPNLFDAIEVPPQNSLTLYLNSENHTLEANKNTYCNYSQQDYVSLNLGCEVIDPFIPKSITTQLPTNQTDKNANEKIASLKAQIQVLSAQLFESEEAYNDLLLQYKFFLDNVQPPTVKNETRDNSSQTNEDICDKCSKFENLANQRECDYSAALFLIKELEETNAILRHEFDDYKTAVHLEKEKYVESYRKVTQENDVLKKKIDKLDFTVVSQKSSNRNDIEYLRKVLIDQIGFIKSTSLVYYLMLQNKCKHMIWELDDIKSITNDETLPTKSEVEENLTLWKKALDDATKSHYMLTEFYDNLHQQFSKNVYDERLLAVPLPNMLAEPPSIILRHFKSIFVVNKRLEKELHKQMAVFYKMISTPYPGFFPHKQLSSEVYQEMVSNANMTITEIQNNSKTIQEIIDPGDVIDIKTNSDNETITSEKLIKTNSNIASVSDVTEDENFNFNTAHCSKTDIEPSIFGNKNIKTAVSATGTIPKNKIAIKQPLAVDSKKNDTSKTKIKPDVVGQESLILKLQQKLPLVSPQLITKAVQMMRDKHGSLTGMNSKVILLEIKDILKELTSKEKAFKRSIEKAQEKPVQVAWKTINNGIHWNNEDPDVNCTICFETMTPKTQVKLRCQHVFHSYCIKKWLQNDSICPICRSFTTLDEEFPPLK